MLRGTLVGPIGGLLGLSCRPLGISWAALGAILEDFDQTRCELQFAPPREPQHSSLGALLERSWARLGALVGLSWGSFWLSWSNLEASEGYPKGMGDDAKHIGFLRCLIHFGFLAAPLEVSEASWSRLGAFLGPLAACWEPS